MSEFMECPTCAAKTGMPTLCESCLHNRGRIADLGEEVLLLNLEAKMVKDAERMNEIKRRVVASLKGQGATLSPFNIIRAMFLLDYAKWPGTECIYCEYER